MFGETGALTSVTEGHALPVDLASSDTMSPYEPLVPASRNASTTSSGSGGSSCSSRLRCKGTSINVENAHRCSILCTEKYPLHHAARYGHYRKLKDILQTGQFDPLEQDECLLRTPLHYACATGNVDKGLVCVKILLETPALLGDPATAADKVKKYVNTTDKFKKSAIHLAAKNEATMIVIELLTNQASFDISSIDGTCALREIYKHTPDAMNEALNQSISYVEMCSRPNMSCDNVSLPKKGMEFDFTRTCVNVCLDFYPVIGSKMTKAMCSVHKGSEPQKLERLPESRFMFTINRKRMETGARRQILTNVLVQSFLYFKWQKVKWFCYLAIAFHMIWLSLYISTVIGVHVINCPYATSQPEENNTLIQNVADLPFPTETPCKAFIVTQTAAGLLLLMSCMVTTKEFFQMIRLRSMYLRFENLGQCLLLSFIYLTVPDIYLFGFAGWKISAIDYQVSAFGIFLAWTLMLCQLAKFPRLIVRINWHFGRGMLVFPDHGIYVEILSRVFKNFLIFITIFSSLLISFVFSFNILLPNSTGFQDVPFPVTVLKVLTMMTGELNYDDMFHSEDTKLVYPISSHLMYGIFIMVATIILFNLLIGFTVSDIQGLQKDAEINQISNKLEQIFLMECFLLSGFIQRVACLVMGAKKATKLFDKIMVVKSGTGEYLCYHTTIKALPYELRVRIRSYASKKCLAISDVCGAVRNLVLRNRNFEH